MDFEAMVLWRRFTLNTIHHIKKTFPFILRGGLQAARTLPLRDLIPPASHSYDVVLYFPTVSRCSGFSKLIDISDPHQYTGHSHHGCWTV